MAAAFFARTALAIAACACTCAQLIAAETPCAGASAQAKDLRVKKETNTSAIEVFDQSAQAYRVVFRSIAKIELPRRSPDGTFLAYVSTEPGSPWLYLQRLSTGAREAISELDPSPTELCFDPASTVIHTVTPSGTAADYNIEAQMKLLPSR